VRWSCFRHGGWKSELSRRLIFSLTLKESIDRPLLLFRDKVFVPKGVKFVSRVCWERHAVYHGDLRLGMQLVIAKDWCSPQGGATSCSHSLYEVLVWDFLPCKLFRVEFIVGLLFP
jgi:hypothetical protein